METPCWLTKSKFLQLTLNSTAYSLSNFSKYPEGGTPYIQKGKKKETHPFVQNIKKKKKMEELSELHEVILIGWNIRWNGVSVDKEKVNMFEDP